jgi:hypothetical protein
MMIIPINSRDLFADDLDLVFDSDVLTQRSRESSIPIASPARRLRFLVPA